MKVAVVPEFLMSVFPVVSSAGGRVEALADVVALDPETGERGEPEEDGWPADRSYNCRELDPDSTTTAVRVEGSFPGLEGSRVRRRIWAEDRPARGMAVGAEEEPAVYRGASSRIFFGGYGVAHGSAFVEINGEGAANAPSGVQSDVTQQFLFVGP